MDEKIEMLIRLSIDLNLAWRKPKVLQDSQDFSKSFSVKYFDPENLRFVKPQLTMFGIQKLIMKGGWSGFTIS